MSEFKLQLRGPERWLGLLTAEELESLQVAYEALYDARLDETVLDQEIYDAINREIRNLRGKF